jgi:hypothetical protein
VALALRRTQRALFSPLDVRSWLALAVCAFLAGLSDAPSSLAHVENRVSGDGTSDGGFGALPISGWRIPSLDELLEALTVAVAVAWVVAAVLAVLLAIGLLFAWLSARGEMMLLDGVVRGRGSVVEPWSRLRRQGNSLFCARVVLVLAVFSVMAVLAVSLMLSLARHGELGFAQIVPAILVLAGIIAIAVILDLLLTDLVTPVLYLRDRGVVDAMGAVWSDLIAPHAPAVILFYVLRLLLYLAAAVIMILVSCLTCCIAALPLISAIVFLPIHVFFRAYSASFVDQLGGPYTLFADPNPTGEEPAGPAGSQACD